VVTVKLYDAAGNVVSSTGPTLVCDVTAPTAPTSTPASYADNAGTVTSGASTSATTDDTTPGVFVGMGLTDTPKLYANGVQVVASYDSTAGTLTPTTALADGTQALTYTLTDAAGNESTQSPALTVTVDTAAPSAATGIILTPSGGTVVADTVNSTNTALGFGATIAAGQATGGKAEFYVNGSLIGTDSSIAAGDTSVAYTTSDGTPTSAELQTLIAAGGVVTVKLYDAAGNVVTSTGPTLVRDVVASTAPTSAPASYTDNVGDITSAASTASTTDDTTPGVYVGIGLTDTPKLYVDGTRVDATYNSSNGTLTPTTAVSAGTAHNFTYTLTDAAGNESAQSPALSVTIDTAAPSAATGITLTPSGGTVVANTVNSTNTALDFAASITAGQANGGKAEFYVNGSLIGTDSSIAAGDTSVGYSTSDGTPTTAELQTLIAAGGVVTRCDRAQHAGSARQLRRQRGQRSKQHECSQHHRRHHTGRVRRHWPDRHTQVVCGWRAGGSNLRSGGRDIDPHDGVDRGLECLDLYADRCGRQ
jgi:hypothetical protein